MCAKSCLWAVVAVQDMQQSSPFLITKIVTPTRIQGMVLLHHRCLPVQIVVGGKFPGAASCTSAAGPPSPPAGSHPATFQWLHLAQHSTAQHSTAQHSIAQQQHNTQVLGDRERHHRKGG